MKKMNFRALPALSLLVLLQLVAARHAAADLEWTQTKQMRLEATPLDVAASPDGKWIFVLSEGEIQVYGQNENILKRIPVDKSFDRVAYSATDNSLIVTSSADKSMKIIQVDVVHAFSFEGLPFKGPKNAPVTLAVFSDYQ